MNLISKAACSVSYVLALCLCGAEVLASAAAAADKPRPNIVVLVADDWGFSDVGAYGGAIATPNIDELARHGVRFSNFHVAASCAPTRSMLLTGVDNHLNGVGNLRETMPQGHLGKPGYLGSLDTNVVTVATLLQDSGYRTYIAGKWNVGSEPYNLPNRRGFDRSIIQGDTGSDNWVPGQRYLPHGAKVNWFEDGKEPVMPAEFYSSQYFVDRVIGYIDSGATSGKPFFAYVGFQANHVPLQAPRAFIDKYQGRYDAGWAVLRNARRYEARRMEVYAAMADAMDFHLGRLVAHLKAIGEYDNTVFVFLSDNGPEGADYADARLWLMTQYTQDIEKLGARGAFSIMGPSWASASAAPLNMYKFYAGEGGIRVPLIIAGVPGMAQNQIQRSLAHVTDIVPTLLDLAQVAHPGTHYNGRPIEALTGRSLLPVLTGQAERVHDADEKIGYELAGNQALFKGDLKLVKDSPPLGDGLWHLYDLRTDPGETQDLHARMPEVFRAMQADYEAYARSHRVLPMPPGYNPVRQVLINSFVNYWIPTYRDTVLASLAGLLALGVAIVVLRRRRRD